MPEKRITVYIRRRRQELYDVLNAIKLERGCVDCGYRAHAIALDFDHRDPSQKDRAIYEYVIRVRPLAEILLEVAKCDVRCANCHRVRTLAEKHSRFRVTKAQEGDDPQPSLFGEDYRGL